MSEPLHIVLARLREGAGLAGDLDRARELVRGDARLPEELRAVAFQDPAEASADAAGLLAVLGLDDLGPSLAEAVRAEAVGAFEEAPDLAWEGIAAALREGLEEASRGVELAEPVMRRLPVSGAAHAALVGPAVAAEAGRVELAAAVAAELGLEAPPVWEAVLAEAGRAEVADAVLAELGLGRLPVREAVLAESGRVDVVGGVMAAIGAWSVVAPAAVPAPATRWPRVAALALAAVALLSVVVGRLAVPVESEHLRFASGAEVQIEDLAVASDVQVAQLEGDGGAVILWLDEEA